MSEEWLGWALLPRALLCPNYNVRQNYTRKSVKLASLNTGPGDPRSNKPSRQFPFLGKFRTPPYGMCLRIEAFFFFMISCYYIFTHLSPQFLHFGGRRIMFLKTLSTWNFFFLLILSFSGLVQMHFLFLCLCSNVYVELCILHPINIMPYVLFHPATFFFLCRLFVIFFFSVLSVHISM